MLAAARVEIRKSGPNVSRSTIASRSFSLEAGIRRVRSARRYRKTSSSPTLTDTARPPIASSMSSIHAAGRTSNPRIWDVAVSFSSSCAYHRNRSRTTPMSSNPRHGRARDLACVVQGEGLQDHPPAAGTALELDELPGLGRASRLTKVSTQLPARASPATTEPSTRARTRTSASSSRSRPSTRPPRRRSPGTGRCAVGAWTSSASPSASVVAWPTIANARRVGGSPPEGGRSPVDAGGVALHRDGDRHVAAVRRRPGRGVDEHRVRAGPRGGGGQRRQRHGEDDQEDAGAGSHGPAMVPRGTRCLKEGSAAGRPGEEHPERGCRRRRGPAPTHDHRGARRTARRARARSPSRPNSTFALAERLEDVGLRVVGDAGTLVLDDHRRRPSCGRAPGPRCRVPSGVCRDGVDERFSTIRSTFGGSTCATTGRATISTTRPSSTSRRRARGR